MLKAEKLNPKLLAPPLTFTSGKWLVEPLDDFTDKLIASKEPAENRRKDVRIRSNKDPIDTLWEVDEKTVRFLERYPDPVNFEKYLVSRAGSALRRVDKLTSIH